MRRHDNLGHMANKKEVVPSDVLNVVKNQVSILGRTYKDKLTGLKGTAISRTTFLYACVRIAVQPPLLKKDDGGPSDAFYIDEQLLEEVPNSRIVAYEEEPDAVVLGNTYRDSITDFEGVAISLTKFLSSSQRVALQSSKLHEGKLIEPQYFDAHQLNEVKAKKTPKPMDTKKEPGGPGDCAKPPACAKR